MPAKNDNLEVQMVLPNEPGEDKGVPLPDKSLGTLTNTVVDTKTNEIRPELDPEAILARELAINLPQFKSMVDTLSSRQLKRVLKAIVEVPLNDVKYKATSEAEKFIFKCADTILQCKYSLMLRTYADHLQELQDASEGKNLQETKIDATIDVAKGETNV